MINVLAAAIGTIFSVCAFLFVAILAQTVVGGIVGWVVGMVFPFVITSLNSVAGLSLTGFQIGAVLGFVSGFLRSKRSKSS